MAKSRYTALIKSGRDREILECGLIIGSLIAGMQAADKLTFTLLWSCDVEMADWAVEAISQWVSNMRPESYFSDFIFKKLKDRESELRHQTMS